MRRTYLELSAEGGQPHKFWAAEVRGRELVISWGRIGAQPREHVVLADSQAEARELAARRVRSKLRRGYQPARPGERAPLPLPPSPPDPRQLALALPDPPEPRRRRRRQEVAHEAHRPEPHGPERPDAGR